MNPSDHDDNYTDTLHALAAAMANDKPALARTLNRITDRGPHALYCSCVAWAAAFNLAAAQADLPPDTHLALIATDPAGHPINPDTLTDPAARAQVWAVRFLTAQGNDPQIDALFRIALADEDNGPQSILTLLQLAGNAVAADLGT
jgi:hypothetical protein